MTYVLSSSILSLQSCLMTLGRRCVPDLSVLQSFKLSLRKRHDVARLRRSFAGQKSARKKTGSGESVVNVLPIVHLTVTENGNVTWTAEIVHTEAIADVPPDTVGALSLMLTRPTGAKLSPRERRIIVSRAWLKVWFLRSDLQNLAATANESAIMTETAVAETEIANASEIVIETESGREIASVTENGNETETETAIVSVIVSVIVIANTIPARVGMSLRVTTTANVVIARKSVSGCIGDVLRKHRWKNFHTVTSDQRLPADDDPKMTMVVSAENPEIPRYVTSGYRFLVYGILLTMTLQRVKREQTPRERSPKAQKVTSPLAVQPVSKKEDDGGIHSGSEEGEIEED